MADFERKARAFLFSAGSAGLLLAAACGRRDAEPTGTAAQAQPIAQPATPAEPAQPARSADLVWTVPAGWKEMPARPMRKATYQVPGDTGPAEVAVFYFGSGQGGDVETNVARWLGQFQGLPEGQARREQLQLGAFTVSTVRVERGTFLSGMPGGATQPQANWGLNAAIVGTPSGPYFFKMTGPTATVDAEEGRFSELLHSVQLGS